MGRKDKQVPLENIAALQLGARMRQARQAKGVTLTVLAQRLSYTKSHLSAVENGISRPSQELVERYEQALGLEAGELLREQSEGIQGLPGAVRLASTSRAGREREAMRGKDARTIQSNGSERNERPDKTEKTDTLDRVDRNGEHAILSTILPPAREHRDSGEAPHITELYGRDEELARLNQWMLQDTCNVVSILGIGGIGKTALAAYATEQVANTFQYVFWRSLQNGPQLETILEKCILFFSNQQESNLPTQIDELMLTLMTYLRRYRCLIVLDNVESILEDKQGAGQYRRDYEAYGKLFDLLGKSQHESCLLLTSREKPKEIARLESNTGSVRSLELDGLEHGDGRELLKDEGLFGSDDDWMELNGLYSGIPLALKLAAEPIRELFSGDIGEFLKEDEAVVGDVYDLLEQQFYRLSGWEQEIMYWLAIEREPVSLDTLWNDVLRPGSKAPLMAALKSLRRRFMIDTSSAALFTMQPVIMEYVINRFVDTICEEIHTGALKLFSSHALMKAQTKDYLRLSQVRLIIEPLLNRLLTMYGKEDSRKKLVDMLDQRRRTHPNISEYTAGNILNMLVVGHFDLRELDFSHLAVWQAYLQDVSLSDVNFSDANLSNSVFSETFGGILSVRYSPDGQLLAGGTADGEIRFWNAANGTPQHTFQGHADWIRAIAFSPDGTLIASCSDDQTVRIWSVDSSQCLQILSGHTRRVYTIAFSPDGKTIASGSEDRTIRLWNTQTGKHIKTLQGHSSRVWSVNFSPNGRRLVSGGEDNAICVWDAQSGKLLKTLQGHHSRVWCVRYSPDGSLIASSSDDQTVRLWDAASGALLHTLHGHNKRVCEVAFSPDGQQLVSGSEDSSVRIWNVHTGQTIRTLQGHTSKVRTVAYHPDGRTIASGGENQTIRIWEVDGGQNLQTLQGHSNWIYAVAFSPDSTSIAAAYDDYLVHIWNIESETRKQQLRGHTDHVRAVAYSADGNTIASGAEDDTIRLWTARTSQSITSIQEHTDRVYAVAFNPAGTVLLSGSEDRSARLWEVPSGQHLQRLDGHTDWVRSVAFSPDGETVASGSEDCTVRLWEVKSGQCFAVLEHTDRVWAVTYSPDLEHPMIASAGDDRVIRLWDARSGQRLNTLQGHTMRVWSLAFSPDLQHPVIASAGEDRVIRLWNARSGQCLKTLQGHTNRVTSVSFSTHGKFLASGSHDGSIRIWDVHGGQCLHTLRGERPYERVNISRATGLTLAQKTMLIELGAMSD